MKILVSDFDGTLFDDNFENNIQAVNEFVEKGNIFIIATGRNVTSLTNELEEKNLKYNFLICNDGGTIYNSERQLMAYKKINPDSVPVLYDILDRNRKAVTEVFIDMGGEYSIDTNDQCITMIAKIKDRDKAEVLLNDILAQVKDINGYLSKNWVNIINREVSKANAINFILQKYNLNKDDVYTIGDDVNDITMIKNYHGYVINHYDELLNYSNNEVQSLESLILKLNESNNN